MKALVLNAIGRGFDFEDVDIATPIGHEVLVEVQASGLCHTDLLFATHDFVPTPAVLGHEVAGIVSAIDKVKTQVRDMTRPTRGISLPQLVEELTPYLIGWRGYFGFCQTPRVLTNLEAWIRRRLRSYLWRQWQNGHNRFNELRR